MAGEIIQAENVESAERQLMAIYNAKSIEVKEITQEEYEAVDKSEREDSDNHLNIDRLGQDTKIVDLAYYKFLEDRWTAFRIDLVDEHQKVKKQLYFKALPREDQ
ncbi:hypothetical protein ACFL3C_03455 [Patescibacteria group bacterium]